MAVKLNQEGFDYAQQLIQEGKVVIDERDDWSEHKPSPAEENAFIEAHGFKGYSLWHLGFDNDEDEDTKQRYKFPYGDFKKVHRCAILAAESRAGQYKYKEIEKALAQLHRMIDASK